MIKQGLRYALLLTFTTAACPWLLNLQAQQPTPSSGFTPQELQKFAALNPIDSHTHIYQYTPEYVAFLHKLNLHTLDIMDVSDNADPERKVLSKESADVFELVHKSDHHVFAVTTFDPYLFNQPNFATNAIAELNHSFEEGAVAVKEWKNVGMQVKNAKGQYIMPDDPALAPIYKDIAAHHKTLIMHIADPDTAWLPPNPKANDGRYFVEHPEWYMYKIPGSPSKDQILKARDHVVAMNPNLKVVGAHLGSMEGDFPRIEATLDRYPNFAVDLTSRLPYIMKLPREQAIAFFTKHQDKLIYGTDDTYYRGDIQKLITGEESSYARDWRFLATNEKFMIRGIETQGLALPDSILRKVYHENAVHWVGGVN